jgi:hypothetical protein
MEEQKIDSGSQTNKYARRGFFFMLGGPAILLFFSLLRLIDPLPQIISTVASFSALVLPGIGAILCIASLRKRKELDKVGITLSIITLVMCNPLFYFFWFVICSIAGSELAGMAWM